MDPQDQARDSHAAVDISLLAQELREEPAAPSSSANLVGGSHWCPIKIAEVPHLIRNVEPMEYDPQHVSIGPYHWTDNPELAKKRSFRAVLLAASPGMTEEMYLEEVAQLERQARRSYQKSFEMSSTKFVRMLLLDACYLLVQFGEIDKYVDGLRRNDAITGTTEGHAQGGYQSNTIAPESARGGSDKISNIDVVRDVFYMAENQIPFFVVDKIHQLTILGADVSAADTMAQDIQKRLQKHKYSMATPNVAEPPGPGNLLHLLHMHFKLTDRQSSTEVASTTDTVRRWRTATDYYFAGVKLKKRLLDTDGCQCILDVKLVNGGSTLEIPCLNIDNETWGILRNLIALEQENHETTGSDVTAYCVFMCQLACNENDVEFLSRRGIISHDCGNHDEVADLFSGLCKGIKFDKDDDKLNYLKATCHTLEKRFQSRWRRWMAWLKQRYFKNPWITIGLTAAVVGLTCAVVQAIYSVLSYKHQ